MDTKTLQYRQKKEERKIKEHYAEREWHNTSEYLKNRFKIGRPYQQQQIFCYSKRPRLAGTQWYCGNSQYSYCSLVKPKVKYIR